MLHCYVGYWEERFSMSPHQDEEATMLALGPLALVVDDRRVLIAPDPSGNLSTMQDSSKHQGRSLRYSWNLNLVRPWARFMLHETQMETGDGYLEWEVPADHLLGWPRLVTRDGFDVEGIARRELYMRGQSAYGEGGLPGLSRMIRGTPRRIRVLVAGAWGPIIDAIIREEEFPCT